MQALPESMNKYLGIYLWCESEPTSQKFIFYPRILCFLFAVHLFFCISKKTLPSGCWSNTHFTFLTEENSETQNMVKCLKLKKNPLNHCFLLGIIHQCVDIFNINLNFCSSDQQQVMPNISFQLIFLTEKIPTSALIEQLLFCFEVTEENPIRKSSFSFPIFHTCLELDN